MSTAPEGRRNHDPQAAAVPTVLPEVRDNHYRRNMEWAVGCSDRPATTKVAYRVILLHMTGTGEPCTCGYRRLADQASLTETSFRAILRQGMQDREIILGGEPGARETVVTVPLDPEAQKQLHAMRHSRKGLPETEYDAQLRYDWLRAVVGEDGPRTRTTKTRRQRYRTSVKAVAFALDLLMRGTGRLFRGRVTMAELVGLSGYAETAVRAALKLLTAGGWITTTGWRGVRGGIEIMLCLHPAIAELRARRDAAKNPLETLTLSDENPHFKGIPEGDQNTGGVAIVELTPTNSLTLSGIQIGTESNEAVDREHRWVVQGEDRGGPPVYHDINTSPPAGAEEHDHSPAGAEGDAETERQWRDEVTGYLRRIGRRVTAAEQAALAARFAILGPPTVEENRVVFTHLAPVLLHPVWNEAAKRKVVAVAEALEVLPVAAADLRYLGMVLHQWVVLLKRPIEGERFTPATVLRAMMQLPRGLRPGSVETYLTRCSRNGIQDLAFHFHPATIARAKKDPALRGLFRRTQSYWDSVVASLEVVT